QHTSDQPQHEESHPYGLKRFGRQAEEPNYPYKRRDGSGNEAQGIGVVKQGKGPVRLNAGVPVKQLLAQFAGEGHGFPNGFAPFLPGLLKQKIQAHFFSSLASRCRITLLFICIRMASAKGTS
ncbi:MAG: hypothetical protein J5828_02345, partial [Desulfovibrionaceae bacterium]|nr:hypothetical protein [Desulfovibrionaceae bacterium]